MIPESRRQRHLISVDIESSDDEFISTKDQAKRRQERTLVRDNLRRHWKDQQSAKRYHKELLEKGLNPVAAYAATYNK